MHTDICKTYTCNTCGKSRTISLDIHEYKSWKNGKCIQQAFPEIDTNTRELMISGMCGKCFEAMCKEVTDKGV